MANLVYAPFGRRIRLLTAEPQDDCVCRGLEISAPEDACTMCQQRIAEFEARQTQTTPAPRPVPNPGSKALSKSARRRWHQDVARRLYPDGLPID